MRTLKVSEKNRDFFSQVYQVVREIPRGRVTSYGAIAKFLGSAGSARMVGWAMNASHKQIENIPAHRVVNRNGILTGKHHFNPPEKMIQLLEFEGVIVKNDEVRDFDKVFWDPIIELDIE
ncbi:MAG TPA: cysteine methyltransferase [Flavobacteriales bacterium]|jgi:methylated-DNA-protein-cysteine methyltransferase-like protein|nr:cysteine methyltransferase [Flavobacteriales bacterium]